MVSKLKSHILSFPRSIKKILAIFLDVVICFVSIWLTFFLRLDQWGMPQEMQWLSFVVALAIFVPLFIFNGFYRAIFRYIKINALDDFGRVFLIYFTLYLVVFTLIRIDDIPRSVGIIQPILFFIGIFSSRFFISNWLGKSNVVSKKSLQPRHIALIYGAGSVGRELASVLSIGNEILVVGYIDDNQGFHGSSIDGVFVFNSPELPALIKKFGITDILLAVESANQSHRREIISSLEGHGVRVRTLPTIMNATSGLVRYADLQDLDMNDLLNREVVPPDLKMLKETIEGKVILVTGAGGSIGSELCRQIVNLSPKKLVLIDFSEFALYTIYEELKRYFINMHNGDVFQFGKDMSDSISKEDAGVELVPCLVSVRDKDQILKIFNDHQPLIVFHAAAYKHVPLVEENPIEGIRNNVFGAISCAQISMETGVSKFIFVSTDKAVRPTNVMGASKRIGELYLQATAEMAFRKGVVTKFSMVRFGNVLGSSGSVAPLFAGQIKSGGPITLTHPDVTRYFMTIPEAAQLVIQSCSMAAGGEVFVLDMGEPVRIYDLALKMVYLSGLMVRDELNPGGDIEIKITGLRPGEKLYEELLIGNNPHPTDHPKILKALEEFIPWAVLELELETLNNALETSNYKMIQQILKRLVPGYHSSADIT
jgi:FlaA1/EpsC-like NDP-sugar epimerase